MPLHAGSSVDDGDGPATGDDWGPGELGELAAAMSDQRLTSDQVISDVNCTTQFMQSTNNTDTQHTGNTVSLAKGIRGTHAFNLSIIAN